MITHENLQLSLVIPVYNEGVRLEKAIIILYEFLNTFLQDRFEIIISDDGSSDNTPAIARKLSEDYPEIKALSEKVNHGRGYAIKNTANIFKGKFMIFMDCDLPFSIDLNYLKQMYELLKNNQVVIASRFHPQAKIKRKWHRALISLVYRIIIKIVFPGFNVTDPDVGFKGFQARTFKEVIKYTDLNGWSWDLQFLMNAHHLGFKIKEFPFNWDETIEYRSTVKIFQDSLSEFNGLLYVKKQLLKNKVLKNAE